MDADLDTLATALYVRTDDLRKAFPIIFRRPAVGMATDLRRRGGDAGGDAGLLWFTSVAPWLRFAANHLHHLFPYLPQAAGAITSGYASSPRS